MVVFENEEGQLVEFQTTTTYTLGVHWADIYTNNTTLELVAIGDFLNNLPPFTGGRNYIFGLDGGQLTQIDYFTSELQLGKIVSGDFVGNDGIVELVASTNFPEHDTACLVILYENLGDFTGPGDCVSQKGSTNLNAADFNNDGYLDLALSSFDFLGGGEAFVIVNNGEGITATTVTPVAIDSGLTSTPSELVWGDYDRDGYLDIAEALPRGNHKNRVRVYRNLAGMGFTMTQEITTVRGPFAIEWGDFDRDGYLDLMLEDVPPRYYRYTGGTPLFEGFQLSQLSDLTRIRRMRGIDYDNDGDLDFSMTDLFEPSRFFEVVAPSLSLSLEPVSAIKANSVTWGDVDGDERLDLLFGAGISQLGSRIYRNIGPSFVQTAIFTGSGFGPHSAAFGDVNADGMLDTAISTFGLNQIFYNGVNNVPNWRSTTALASHEIAWADSDLDNRGLLDLLVANNGRNALYLNSGLQTASSGSVWESDEVEDTRSVAWGYFDDDLLPDFAAGNDNQPTRVYRNLDGQSFQVVWSSHSSFTGNTRDVAWGDYDLDGDMDLAVGNFGQPNYIYENLGNMSLSATPVWTSTTFDQTPAFSKTTSLAWGDWNNDGRLDLAVGNYGENDQVYADVGISSQAVLTLLWESEEHHQTTDVAWGDRDNDGDLDLAISQDGNGQNGVYTNTYVLAAHLANNFTQFMPLPNNPSYLSIGRPGRTKDAYLFSSAEVFSITQPLNPPTVALEVAIPFRVYDPDGTRDVSQLDALGDRIAGVDYHFSLDGGITWKKATSVTLDYDQTTSRLGQTGIITWNAGLDLGNTAEEAVSDDVRFRLSIVHENNGGPVQKVATSAVSPPFRIRRLTCLWPNNPTIEIQVMGGLDSPTRFFGRVSEAEKDVVYSWDFGDGEPVELNQGQLIEHTYKSPGVYTVELTVSGQACPTTRVAVTTRQLVIGGAKIYLPLILKPGSSRQITDIITTSEPTENIIKQIITGPDAPAQVTGVHGEVTFDGSGTQLNWEPNLVDDVVLGYRVYRSPVGQASLQLLASTPPEIRRYTDTTAICGYYYFITAFNRFGESLASDTSYYSPPCR
jgi:hypothetical protein